MTGWRVGWMVTPARYAETLAALSECFNTGTTVFTQPAAIAALEQGESIVQELRAGYARGREIVMSTLGQDPIIQISEPEGAFYVFARIPGLRSSLRFAERLADEARVGVAPGYTFGPGNEEYFRICFAQSHERLAEALQRTRDFVHREHASLVSD
ncbi:MAG: aminotransferase class I/II-fold pyridoxal phosphate-dependent enzyme, partial [Gammaproteobacteria bacterium]|nr:aminotransferase class I/II-fold pyridoxal phosphate-dependent enzyme [Gammaproteobacteria bacterium]